MNLRSVAVHPIVYTGMEVQSTHTNPIMKNPFHPESVAFNHTVSGIIGDIIAIDRIGKTACLQYVESSIPIMGNTIFKRTYWVHNSTMICTMNTDSGASSQKISNK